MSDFIRIVEVGPRDGLQNEKTPVPLDLKLAFIQNLASAGLSEIEATSFVSPKWVPQLADAAEIWQKLPPGPAYSALVPNLRGLETALGVGCRRIALFTAASDDFTKANINQSVEESLQSFAEVAQVFRSEVPNGWIRGYVSTAFACPYAGEVSPKSTLHVVERLLTIGVDEISIGDTIGIASPKEVKLLLRLLLGVLPAEKIACHFHDTRGTAIANVCASLEQGIRIFDSSAGGLGGCPYAVGAGGNLATEGLVYLLQREGLSHTVDLEKLAIASIPVLNHLGKVPQSKAQMAFLAELQRK